MTDKNHPQKFKNDLNLINSPKKPQFFDSFSEILLVELDFKGNIERVNQTICEIVGYPKNEIIGKNLFDDFMPKSKIAEVKLFFADLNATKNEESKNIEFLILTKKEKEILVSWTVKISKVGDENKIKYLCKGINITKRKLIKKELFRALEKAKENERHIRILIDHAPIGIALFDSTNGSIIDLNSKFAEIAGRTVKEMRGMDWMSITHPDDLNLNLENFALMNSGNVDHFKMEKRFIKADSSIIWISITIVPIKIENTIIKKHIAMIEDIGNRKQCEVDLQVRNTEIIAQNINYKKINKELTIAKKEAEESNQLKTEFLNNLSHEIRTPLNGILGFSELLNSPNLSDAKRKNFVNIIQNSGNQLLHIIDEILEISMLGTKRVTLNENQVCLNDLLLELFSVFDLKAKENSIPLYLKKGLSDQNCTLITDVVKLNKIISNLLENALKFTKDGFIEFGYYLKNETTKNQLIIYVKDTGIGIEKEKQEIIFERFSQGEKELSKKVGGIGLGLSIAKENTELLGGSISLESTVGKGTTFFVAIPFKPVNIFVEYEIIEAKPIILIAEDEEINYLYLETVLQDVLKIGCNFLHAKNGLEAIDLYKKNPSINLVLMDLKMPILNGFEATKQLKKLNPNLPIIAQTAYSTTLDKDKALLIGCDGFISKPINVDDLGILIGKHIKI